MHDLFDQGKLPSSTVKPLSDTATGENAAAAINEILAGAQVNNNTPNNFPIQLTQALNEQAQHEVDLQAVVRSPG